MNEILETPDSAPLADLIEILDADGNPTGEYRPREAAQAGTAFIPAEDADVEVTIHFARRDVAKGD